MLRVMICQSWRLARWERSASLRERCFAYIPLPRSARTFSFTARDFATMQRHVLSIQDSKLAHTALQIRCAGGDEPSADILFEATEAGINAQESQLG